jgi:hypothetical protein
VRIKRPWPFLIGIVAVVAVLLLAIAFADIDRLEHPPGGTSS